MQLVSMMMKRLDTHLIRQLEMMIILMLEKMVMILPIVMVISSQRLDVLPQVLHISLLQPRLCLPLVHHHRIYAIFSPNPAHSRQISLIHLIPILISINLSFSIQSFGHRFKLPGQISNSTVTRLTKIVFVLLNQKNITEQVDVKGIYVVIEWHVGDFPAGILG